MIIFVYFSCFLEIGNGWGPAVLDTQEEHDFIREGQKTFTNSLPYWIGGFTNEPNATINYTEYIANNSGTSYNGQKVHHIL